VTGERRTRQPGRYPNRRGPVLSSPIRADVRLTDSQGFTRRFSTWQDVHAWMGSAEFTRESGAVTSIRIIAQSTQAGGAAKNPGERPEP
jgi:hypothetical protein